MRGTLELACLGFSPPFLPKGPRHVLLAGSLELPADTLAHSMRLTDTTHLQGGHKQAAPRSSLPPSPPLAGSTRLQPH